MLISYITFVFRYIQLTEVIFEKVLFAKFEPKI